MNIAQKSIKIKSSILLFINKRHLSIRTSKLLEKQGTFCSLIEISQTTTLRTGELTLGNRALRCVTLA